MHIFSKRTHIVVIALLAILNAGVWIINWHNKPVPAAEIPVKQSIDNVRFYIEPAKPDEYYPNIVESYQPFVRTKPDSPLYILSYLYELRDARNQTYPLVFLAEKRIREIEQWKNELTVLNMPRATDPATLLSRWNKMQPGLHNINGFTKLGNYETEIARYGSLIQMRQKEIDNIAYEPDRILEYGMLRAFIRAGYPRIQVAIQESKYGDDVKTYLNTLAFNMQQFLIKNITSSYRQYDASKIRYPLQELIGTGQFGTYEMDFEWPAHSEEIAHNAVISRQDGSIIKGDTFDLSPNDTEILLSLPDLNLIEPAFCGKSQDIYPYPQFNSYALTINHTSEIRTTYSIENQFSKTITPIFHRDFGKEDMLDAYTTQINFPENRENELYLFKTFAADRNIQCSNVAIRASLKPIIRPSLVISKIVSKTNPSATNRRANPIDFYVSRSGAIIRLLTIIYFFSILPVLLKFATTKFVHLPIRVRKHRILFAQAFLIGILMDIFLMSRQSEVLIFIVFILFLLTIASYRINITKQIIAGAVLFAGVPAAYLMNWTVIADKLGVWAFIVGSTVFVQLFFNTNSNPRDDLIDNLISDIQEAIHYKAIERLLKRLRRNARHQLQLYFGARPQSVLDWVIFGWKSILLLVALSSAIYVTYEGINFLNIQVENYKSARLLNKRTPTIISHGPQIVYHGTKVIVRGHEFGYKQTLDVKLLSNNGEVATEFWSNEKIIFSVPLHWKPGTIDLWIEKPMLWEGGWHTISSKHFTIKLIPVTGSFTKDDDAFYKQLKSLDKETLKINGY